MAKPSHNGRQLFSTVNAQMAVKRQKFSKDGEDRDVITLVGFPILWTPSQSSDRGGFVVRLAPGSATFTTPVLALFNHKFDSIIGSTANGSLRIGQADQIGVPVEIDLADTQAGRDVAVLVGDGLIAGMSFSMVNGFEEYTESREGNLDIINVTKFTCDEVSVVACPAFATASVAVADDAFDDDPQYSRNHPYRISASAKLLAARLHKFKPAA